MTKQKNNKRQEEIREIVVELHDCKSGEQILVTYDSPTFAMLCSAETYRQYCKDRGTPVLSDNSQRADDHHEVFTISSDGDRCLVVEPMDDGQPLPKVKVERRPIDHIVWNETHADNKVVRKQPTPYDAPMASTLGYWERKIGHDFPPIYACHICRNILTRDDARCALVSVVGELPRVDYVIPICQHCYDTANGKTFVVQKEALAKAPKA